MRDILYWDLWTLNNAKHYFFVNGMNKKDLTAMYSTACWCLIVVNCLFLALLHNHCYSFHRTKWVLAACGFRKNHSTDTTLIQIIVELLFSLDKNRVSGMVLVDYCKAFDMVDHGLLLDKLKVYGVAGETMKWFQSYLVDRHQLVYLGGCVSDVALMKHGAPQGSILGPLFFTGFINNLPFHVSSSEIDLYVGKECVSFQDDQVTWS